MRKLISLAVTLPLLTACFDSNNVKNFDEAESRLNDLVENTVQPSRIENQYRANIKLTSTNLLELLPDINEFGMAVDVRDNSQTEAVEIFTSSEKAGTGV
ncbi:MAG: VWA domain-containing protein, partial [Reinekea sp.]|nr:VWA domain-containing protein [Reinekea sp.]